MPPPRSTRLMLTFRSSVYVSLTCHHHRSGRSARGNEPRARAPWEPLCDAGDPARGMLRNDGGSPLVGRPSSKRIIVAWRRAFARVRSGFGSEVRVRYIPGSAAAPEFPLSSLEPAPHRADGPAAAGGSMHPWLTARSARTIRHEATRPLSDRTRRGPPFRGRPPISSHYRISGTISSSPLASVSVAGADRPHRVRHSSGAS
jgi:hypothetical protein